MKYYSTKNRNIRAGLEDAVKNGMAPDKGLYMPEKFPVLSRYELERIKKSESLTETGMILARKLFMDDLDNESIEKIITCALVFDTPVVKITDRILALELFHGPTLAFKDVGARFMAQILKHFNRQIEQPIHVLVATSGDTGSAVANGFLDMEGIKVHVLYPSGQVSELQEKQFTTLGKNITALEVDGTFDDCQTLVKQAFADDEIRSKMMLTSANSINLARLLPQSFYYFRAWSQTDAEQLVVSVPSGNYGNLTAGLLAREMGLPVNMFLAASNANDVVPEYLATSVYTPRSSVKTIANAMDVGAPSNFERILNIFDQKHERVSRHIKGYSFSDREIREIISTAYRTHGYILDPHGATGYEAARQFLESNPQSTVVFLETAHPSKFPETVNGLTDGTPEVPDRLKDFITGKKESIPISRKYRAFREYLKSSRHV
ncbi:MAG: threonine synthase [Bacteroidales bacterium]|nr:threonine synthase [Bacteroidales bacterium]